MKPIRVIAASLAMVASMAVAAQAGSGLITVAQTNKHEIGGIAGPAGIAWTEIARRTQIRVDGPDPSRVSERGAANYTGGMDGDVMIYQHVANGGTTSDILLYDVPTSTQLGEPVGINSRWWEFSPFRSGDWILFGRNNIGYGAKREWLKILLVNTDTLEKRVLAEVKPSWTTPGQLTGNWAVWEKCTRRGCSIFRHDIAANATEKITPQASPAYYAPAVTADGTMYFARSRNACGAPKIVQRDPSGTQEVIYKMPKRWDIQEMYVWVDATTEHDLYITKTKCSNGEGDIAYIDSADTLTPLAPGTYSDRSATTGATKAEVLQGQPWARQAAP